MAPSHLQNAKHLVSGLFAASVLLSIVSWYTTYEGMALYLTKWFALLACTGVQLSLLLVAWLMGFTRSRRAQLIAVYAITAVVSVAFSYVSIYRWFSEHERPAIVRRELYDKLAAAAAESESTLSAASAEARKHVLALEEMTQAEKTHGHISRAGDSDPYLSKIRDSVAREAQAVSGEYREGSGSGVRYTAFERYARLAHESQSAIENARAGIVSWRTTAKPEDPADKQLKNFHTAFDSIPWNEVQETLHGARFERPQVPPLAESVDKTASGQEDLMIAFSGLLVNPTTRHIFSFLLAAFIDVIIFLLAYASGPHLAGTPELRMVAAAAALESLDSQIFTRDFLRKVQAAPGGLARIDASGLKPGEAQLLLMLSSRGLATAVEQSEDSYWLLDPDTHSLLVESLAVRGIPLRASRAAI